MASINRRGTSAADKVVVGADEYFDALGGDDDVTLSGIGSQVTGGPGNDTIRVAENLAKNQHAVFYWDSPGKVLVDLRGGFALDGYGTRDTLIGVRSVAGLKRDGDEAYGTAADEDFFIQLDGLTKQGRIIIDAGAGDDTAVFVLPSSFNGREPVFKVSADGRRVTAYDSTAPQFSVVLTGFEGISVYDPNTQKGTFFRPTERISLETAGQDILLRGASGWHSAATLGRSISLSYSFLEARPAEGADGGTGFASFTAGQRAVVRDVLKRLSSETGLVFQETEGDKGQIRFGINQQSDTRGYAFIPGLGAASARDGDVWLDVETAALLQPGQEGFYVLLHELGHALGLQHPLTQVDASGATVLLPPLVRVQNTVMLDDPGTQGMRIWPTWFGMMDLQALRSLYGAKSVAAQDNTYDLGQLNSLLGGLLVDDGGVDTVDLSESGSGVHLDLRNGRSWSFGGDANGQFRANLTLAWTTEIENVKGTPYDDVMVGNALANWFMGQGGNDIIDGGDGVDTVVMKQGALAYRFAYSGDTLTVSARNQEEGATRLTAVEFLSFKDLTVPTRNVFVGGDSDDRFTHAAGHAIVDGGTGSDTLSLPLQSAAYRLGWSSETISLTRRTGEGDTLFLQSVESLQFSNRLIGLQTMAHGPFNDLPDSVYQFFIVAFGAAPGVLYMQQIAEAYRAGATVRQIVDAFISKSQFTDTYPLSLSNRALADKLVANVVGSSASAASREAAAGAIEQTLNNGAPRGQVIFTVFGNLAGKPLQGDEWSGTALQFQKQVAAAKAYTDLLSLATDDLAILRSVLSRVTPDSDISTTSALVELVGLGLLGG